MTRTDLPLPPATLLILLALATGEKHGYSIMQEARRLSGGDFRIGPATLYTTIQRLLDSGWIEEVTGPETSDSRRRYYRLSSLGSSAVKQELRRMEALVKKAKALGLRPAEAFS